MWKSFWGSRGRGGGSDMHGGCSKGFLFIDGGGRGEGLGHKITYLHRISLGKKLGRGI